MKVVLLFVSVVVAAFGQVASSTLLGDVRDESSALVPGVKITASQVATGFSRAVTSAANGNYRIDELLPGRYTVTAEKDGFRNLSTGPLLLEVNQKAKLDIVLKLGSGRDSITVTASVSALQTDDASAGYRLDNSAITDLPLVQRDVMSLVTLGPGAIPRHLGGFVHDVVNDVQANRGAVELNPPINGARSTMNSILLDGAVDTDRTTFAIAVIPPMESVQEFHIQASLASAEFAQAGGGVVDVVTKSGALAWHGSAFEYFRNEAFDARNFFDDPALPRPIFRQSQYGGSLGGKLPAHNTFFFVTYEGMRAKAGHSSLNIVPDATLRSGDFTGRSPIFDPLSVDPATGARRPFPNNVIPSNRIDPIARKFLDQFEPLPNRDGSNNYLDATPSIDNNDNVSGRIDHEFRNHSRMFGRYTINDDRQLQAGIFPELPVSEKTRAQQIALGHTFGGGAWLNEARFSFTRLRVFDLPENAFKNDVARQLGINGFPNDPFNFGLPYFLVTDFSTVTDSPTLPQVQRDNLWHLSEGVSFTRGRHTWKTGFQWIHFQLNYLQSNLPRGQYIFTGAFSQDVANPGATGDAFADFLLGLPQITNRSVGSPQAYLRQNTYAGYFQDDWRVTSRFTVNLGLRYEYFSPYSEARNNLLNLDYSNLPKPPALVRKSSAIRPDRNNFAPRLGIAWTPPVTLSRNHSMVVRAGYGVYFSQEIASETYDLVRNGIRNESNLTDGVTPILTLENGFPKTASTGFPTYFGVDPRAATPYMQQWTAGVQQELPFGIVAELAYIGSKGTKLGRFRTFNTPAHVETGENLPPRPGDLQSLRTFPELGKIIQRQNIANSSYQSLQIKAEKRLSTRASFLASFVWSKSIDDADTVLPGLGDSAGAQDERNLRLERGLSVFNVGRRISAGYSYNLPSGGFLRMLLRNWQTTGIITLQDGNPENPFYFAYDGANSGTPNRPDVVPGQKISQPRRQRTADRWFNTDAFTTPKPYTFGNAGRNILPGPGNIIFDLALNRRFKVRERQALQFRAEFFNAFNHPNFGIPGQYPDFGPFFGKIFATGEPRRIQFALRFEF